MPAEHRMDSRELNETHIDLKRNSSQLLVMEGPRKSQSATKTRGEELFDGQLEDPGLLSLGKALEAGNRRAEKKQQSETTEKGLDW